VDGLIEVALGASEGGGVPGLVAHGLGPLMAQWFERMGLPLPVVAHEELRTATLAQLLAPPLVRRIRDTVDGPLLLFKGPEVAALYPRGGRRFSDVDLLSPHGRAVQDALVGSGFVEVDHESYSLTNDHHHFHPIRFPPFGLNVEIHSQPNWPSLVAKPPPVDEILEASVPASIGVDGISAPMRAHHALLLASHSWRHAPLERLRDLLDIALLVDGLPEAELTQIASRWGIGRLWGATAASVDALFHGGREPLPFRLWAAHLRTARQPTVFENHLQRWLPPYWEAPPRRAAAQTIRTAVHELTPGPGDTWRTKVARTVSAIFHPAETAAARDAAKNRP
jgi:hypothetical protein